MRLTTVLLILATVVIILLTYPPQETNADWNKLHHVLPNIPLIIPRRYRRLVYSVIFGALAAKAKQNTHWVPFPLPLPIPAPSIVEKSVEPIAVEDKGYQPK